MRKIVLVFLFILAGLFRSYAQTFTGNASGSFVVYSIQSITVTSLGGVIGFYSPNDYFNGVIANNYANISVKSNANWLVNFAAQSTNFTALNKGASEDMPASVMGIRINGYSSFKTLSTQSQKLTDGSKGSGTSKHNFDIDVSFNPGFSYSGGLYSMGIVYTLTKQ